MHTRILMCVHTYKICTHTYRIHITHTEVRMSMHTCTCTDMRTLLKRSLKFLPTTAHSDPLLKQTVQHIPGSRKKGDTAWGGAAEKPPEGSSSGRRDHLNLTAHSAFLTGPYLPPPHFQCKPGAAGRPNEYREELRESQTRSILTDEL